MNIQMGHLPEGDLVMVCDQELPSEVKRVEYFRDQKLLMLVYKDGEQEDELMHYELPEDYARRVELKSNLVIIEPDPQTGKQMGYYTSLIQVGA
ncbi:MAG: hypothetical protein DI586_03255 [Micavibrio aeruginosavorus]|uniref:Uncharacterized protein n=1 Tax=Micavibrio aeruginosavorus TaxID=349221 RepID=A0A2W5FRY4_9BACT|nr:MAG: hypothetical protein DI586_03255 [Micavibrio aeruginosavorus]